jgi:uncharacterized protein
MRSKGDVVLLVLRKIVIFTGALAACSVLLLVFVSAAFCRTTLQKHPRSVPPLPNWMTVSVPARDGVRLRAWWLQPSESNGNCVAVLHGIGDSRVGAVGFAPMFLNEGYAVLLPDSRAHGESGGEFVTYGLLERYDIIAWADWMKKAGCRKVYGLGESLGASVLIQAAAVEPAFAAIAAECAYADLREVAEFRVRQKAHVPAIVSRLVVGSAIAYADWTDGLDLRQVSPVDSIARASTPILLIHGLQDFRTPSYNSVRLARANPRNSLWLVPGAAHTGAASTEPAEFRRRVLGWFAQY